VDPENHGRPLPVAHDHGHGRWNHPGLLLIGQNPVIGGHNAGLIRKGLANLEWMVVRETVRKRNGRFLVKTPTARGPEEIKTEMFMLPAAMAGEKDGTFTNTHRLVQWHDKVVDPPATAGPTCGSSTTWANGSRPCTPAARTPRMHPSGT
jgi:anaerobic selenocysteine-containing dehydrogenase